MTPAEKALLREGQEIFTRLIMKFDLMEKIPFVFGRETIGRTQLHTIEAIGKGRGRTVTALADYFMVTKGAVSQVVTKLCAHGFVTKAKGPEGGKEKLLELTKKGWEAFELHENYNQISPEFTSFFRRYKAEELDAFRRILIGLDELSGRIFEELVERSKSPGGGASASPSKARGTK
jgi:DNA-binding MarR family transcriptional regulator